MSIFGRLYYFILFVCVCKTKGKYSSSSSDTGRTIWQIVLNDWLQLLSTLLQSKKIFLWKKYFNRLYQTQIEGEHFEKQTGVLKISNKKVKS